MIAEDLEQRFRGSISLTILDEPGLLLDEEYMLDEMEVL